MGIISFLTALFGAPAAINALLARVDLLEAKLAAYEKAQNDARIDIVTKDVINHAPAAQISADSANVLRNL